MLTPPSFAAEHATPAAQPTTANKTLKIPNETVLEFAKAATLTAFSYDYTNYQQKMKQLADYFTKPGWQSYDTALEASKNLQAVAQHKLTVSATVLNPGKIIKQLQNKAQQQEWIVEIPISVAYTDPNKQRLSQRLIIKLDIITVPASINPRGIAIKRFVGRPDVES